MWVEFGEGMRAPSANPWGAEARAALHAHTAGAQQGHGAQQQPRLTRANLQPQGHPQLLQGLPPEAAPKRKQVALLSNTWRGRKISTQGPSHWEIPPVSLQ